MNNKLTNCKVDSAGLRRRLEDHLTLIFSAKKIGKYLDIDGCGPEIQILSTCGEPLMTLPRIKLAYGIWLAMDAADRHNVLYKFQQYYAALPIVSAGDQKTLIFCALFVHEFSAILAEAMEWPD
jgi:hypothetical protein